MALSEVCKFWRYARNIQHYSRCRFMKHQNFSTSSSSYKTNNPITYSKTKASRMSTSDTLHLKPDPAVFPFERYVIVISLAVLLIYSTILREENKLDEIIGGTYNYEEDDEIKILNALLHAKLKGLKTDDLEKKLNEIRANK